MTTFGLVPGGGHNAWCWSRLVPELESLGHEAIPVTLPLDQVEAGLKDYADAVVEAVGGRDDVVLLGHSLAGRYLALAGGQIPGARCIFLCAIVPLLDEATNPPPPPPAQSRSGRQRTYDELGRLYFTRDEVAELFYNDCDEETIDWAASMLRPQPSGIMREPFPADQWPSDLRSAYILCLEDQTINPTRAHEMAEDRLGVSPLELPGSHSPFFSRPGLLAETVVGLLEDDAHFATRSTKA